MSVAKAYAKALFEKATETKKAAEAAQACDEIEKQLDEFLAVLSGSKEAAVALVSPVTTSKDKAVVVQAIAAKMKLNPSVSQFLTLLAGKGRMGFLQDVRDVFSELRLTAEGGVSAHLTSAEPMSTADVESLAKAFSKKLGKKVSFRIATDPTLLAGVKVTVGGVTYDGTLRSQLVQLRDQFVVSAGNA